MSELVKDCVKMLSGEQENRWAELIKKLSRICKEMKMKLQIDLDDDGLLIEGLFLLKPVNDFWIIQKTAGDGWRSPDTIKGKQNPQFKDPLEAFRQLMLLYMSDAIYVSSKQIQKEENDYGQYNQYE